LLITYVGLRGILLRGLTIWKCSLSTRSLKFCVRRAKTLG